MMLMSKKIIIPTKFKQKKELILSILLIISLFYSNLFSLELVDDNRIATRSKGTVKQASSWNLTGSPIFIDDSDPNYNWSKTAEENDWCTGNGTWKEPYILENITVDGLGTAEYCIEVRNSYAYFQIRNCVVYNASTIIQSAAIHLYNTYNGKIEKNDCSHVFFGIKLEFSDNNSVLSNYFAHNFYGIYLYVCNYSVIESNTCYYNENAIWINGGSHRNIVSKNHVQYNTGTTVFGDFNQITDNTYIECYPGIKILGDYNLVSNNYFNSRYDSGEAIFLSYAQFNNVSNNYVTGGPLDGIELESSCENIVSNNYIQYVKRSCVRICKNSNNNQILGNKIDDCKYGIYSSDSGNLVILGNSVSNARDTGVFTYNGDNTEIKQNNVSLNYNGICLEESANIDIQSNTVNRNARYGLKLYSNSHYNYIFNNTINDNNDGIELTESNYNTIINNTLIGNLNCIVEINSIENIIGNNTCENKVLSSASINGYNWYFIVGLLSAISVITVKIKVNNRNNLKEKKK